MNSQTSSHPSGTAAFNSNNGAAWGLALQRLKVEEPTDVSPWGFRRRKAMIEFSALRQFLIYLSLLGIFDSPFPLLSEEAIHHSVSSSSWEGELFLPVNVFDGDLQTRWSSQFSDPQWLKIDLGSIKDISGLSLIWENAYGKSYEIRLSEDGITWKSSYETAEGDGKTDEIYFKKTPARYIEILCKERATSWGYSLFEVILKGPEEEINLNASSHLTGKVPAQAMDGDWTTDWKSSGSAEEWVLIDLKKPKDFGGLQLNWSSDYAKSYEVLISQDGAAWSPIYSKKDGNGEKDLIYFELAHARYIKLLLKESAAGAGYSLREITLKGSDEFATPQKHFELLAEESPKGYFPKWLSKEQAYWTVVGVHGDEEESLLCEDGTIEPFSKGFSIMPYLFIDGKLITSSDVEVTQSLEKDYLPIPLVKWNYQGLILDQKLFASGKPGESATYVWYLLENRRREPIQGKLYITLRPFQVNPPWQHGGLSEIRRLEYEVSQVHPTVQRTVSDESRSIPIVKVNGSPAILSLIQPDHFGAMSFKEGDIVQAIARGQVLDQKSISDKEGYASGTLEYLFHLGPGEKKSFFWILPLHRAIPMASSENPEDYFNQILQSTISDWESKLNRVSFHIPDQEMMRTFKSNLAYILINNDGKKLQPGSRNYQRAWMRDGAVIAAALLRTGFQEEVKEFLDWIAAFQLPDGMIPFMLEDTGMPEWARDWKEYDSQGQFIYAVLEYYFFAKDKKFLEEKWPAVGKALKFLENLRGQNLTDELRDGPSEKRIFYGILPASNSHEGYFPAQHSYWDDFWALKGLKDARVIAEILERKDASNLIKAQEEDLRKCVYDSIRLAINVKNISYIPGCAEKGDFDANSTAVAVFPCEEYEHLPQPQGGNTFEKYFNETLLPRSKSLGKDSFTPYELRNASAFLWMGDKEKALGVLEYFLNVMRPRSWNHWAEVVFGEYRHPQYLGDMPHTWIGAEYILAVRNLFVYEKDGELILGAGIPSDWLLDSEGVHIKNFPTYFGLISYSIRQDDGGLKAKVWGSAKPPKGFVFKSPRSHREFRFSKLPVEFIISE